MNKKLLTITKTANGRLKNPLEDYKVEVSDAPLAVFDLVTALTHHSMHNPLLRNAVIQSAAALIGLSPSKDDLMARFTAQVEANSINQRKE